MLNFIFFNTVCLHKQYDIYKVLEFFFKVCLVCVNTNLVFNNKVITCALNLTYRQKVGKCSNTLTFLSLLNYSSEFLQLGDVYACCECLNNTTQFNVKEGGNMYMIVHAILHVIKYKHNKLKQDIVMIFIATKIVSFITRKSI
jgi:ssRNA-specific RNase YbeY (16S rRNA maturation enzyme)